MREKKVLTDRAISALKARDKRYAVHDALVPGLAVRVTETGHRSFVLITRFPPDKTPGRQLIGVCGSTSLEEARAIARRWHELIRRGIHPKDEAERLRVAAQREQESEFSVVADKFLARIANQRRAGDARRIVRGVLIPAWRGKRLTEIKRADVVGIVNEIAPRAPSQARAVFGVARSMFNWAIELYGLDGSPCDRVSLKRLIGKKAERKRVLSDDEIRAFWSATGKMGYPFGSLFRLLLLTGARRSEIAKARWSEVNDSLIIIPPERFKSDATHLVPLSTQAMALLDQIPRSDRAVFLFSTTLGERPASKIAEAKARLDALMRDELGASLPHFVTHDLRRTLRTRLASLKVPDVTAEQVLGHGRRGLQRTYDQHSYIDEMREALELWAARLRDLVEPPPPNVLQLRHKI